MSHAPLGFVPLVTAGISIATSLFGSKKAEKKERENYYAQNRAAIQSGEAVSALSLMSEQAIANLRRVWPYIRGTDPFSAIDWNKLGMPNGPGLSALAAQALGIVWPEVRAAARFDDVNWNNHAIPVTQNVAQSMPLPELGYQFPMVQNPGQYYAPPAQYNAASMLPAAETSQAVLLAAGVGVLGLIIWNARR